MTTTALPPPVTWAIRQNVVYLTICVEDCKDAAVDIQDKKIYFKGTGGPDKKLYENTIELYGEINPEKSRKFIRDRNIELILERKEPGPYWPHLLANKVKQHWLKVDFSKWKDEDDSSDIDDEGGEDFLNKLNMEGNNPMSWGDKPGLDDLDDGDETDSDDEDIPDLE